MHTLYAAPFTSSLAVHLVLRQQNLPTTLHWLRRGPARQIQDPAYATLNPRQKVPALLLPDGTLLTEIINILMHLEEGQEAPRQRLTWLSFIATELHQQALGPLFDPQTPPATIKDVLTRLLPPVLGHLESALSSSVLPASGAVDAYLFWTLLLLRNQHPETIATPALTAHRKMMLGRGFVREVLSVEQAAYQSR